MRVVFRKCDLDTCLTAAVLGVSECDTIVCRPEGALPEEIDDLQTCCIEAGGSGGAAQNNFDHHSMHLRLPPACVQAFEFKGRPKQYEALVEFTHRLDTGKTVGVPFPNMSSLMSGILLVHPNSIDQFVSGIANLNLAAVLALDPFDTLPRLRRWRVYFEAKQRQRQRLQREVRLAQFCSTKAWKVGFLETEEPGAPAWLYHAGAHVAVVRRPALPPAELSKYTICGNGVSVSPLLSILNSVEGGWGGPSHGTIIASPFRGSRLTFTELRELILKNAHLFKLQHARRIQAESR